MFSYAAYTLGIRSELPLPELLTTEATTNIEIRLGRVDRSRWPANAVGRSFWISHEECLFDYEEVGAFSVRAGREIRVEPVPEVEQSILRQFLLGPVLAMLLHQRGLLVLHASAIAIDGGAVAFLGASGWGKSTMAAALHVQGHGVVADDVTAIHMAAGYPLVLPSFPQLNLWPESAASLSGIPRTLPLLQPGSEKRACRAFRGFPQASLPLKRLYVLAKGEVPQIELLQPREAVIELIRHTKNVDLLEGTDRADSRFDHCVQLARCVPICRLERQPSLEALPAVAKLVKEDLAQVVSKGLDPP